MQGAKESAMRIGHGVIVVLAVVSVGLLITAGMGTDAGAADLEDKKAKSDARRSQGLGPAPARVVGADAELPESRGTAWVIYDDDSAEQWGAADYSATYDVVGNKFTSTWGTFYCDIVRMYMRFTTDTSGYMSAYNALSGLTLQNNSYITISPGTTTTWIEVDGSVAATGWIGNSAYTFQNTAWIGNDFYPSCEVGIDTNGGGTHGFGVTAYTGTGYAEQAWDAMVRARFNGDNVPVELLGFTVE
jgi:hypothetical protein